MKRRKHKDEDLDPCGAVFSSNDPAENPMKRKKHSTPSAGSPFVHLEMDGISRQGMASIVSAVEKVLMEEFPASVLDSGESEGFGTESVALGSGKDPLRTIQFQSVACVDRCGVQSIPRDTINPLTWEAWGGIKYELASTNILGMSRVPTNSGKTMKKASDEPTSNWKVSRTTVRRLHDMTSFCAKRFKPGVLSEKLLTALGFHNQNVTLPWHVNLQRYGYSSAQPPPKPTALRVWETEDGNWRGDATTSSDSDSDTSADDSLLKIIVSAVNADSKIVKLPHITVKSSTKWDRIRYICSKHLGWRPRFCQLYKSQADTGKPGCQLQGHRVVKDDILQLEIDGQCIHIWCTEPSVAGGSNTVIPWNIRDTQFEQFEYDGRESKFGPVDLLPLYNSPQASSSTDGYLPCPVSI